MAKIKRIILTFLIVFLVFLAAAFFAFYILITPASNDTSEKTFVVESGMTIADVAKSLKSDNLIKNEIAFKILVKLKNLDNIYAAKYSLNAAMSSYDIIESLASGGKNNEEISITFNEGINMRGVASIIASETNNSEDDVYGLLNDTEYLNKVINDYWFVTEDILNSNIYYSLEGYLYPDTYQFASKDVSVEDIFKTMLDKMDEVLSSYKSEIDTSSYSVHELLTIASLTELEGVDDESRSGIASVFYNRLDEGMSLGSDVTTYYAFKIDMGERDLLQSEIDAGNPYNTRGPEMAGKLPVGPIALVSSSSIMASINPSATDNLFFVADKNGKVYFTKSSVEHDAIIEQLQDEGLWYEW